MENKLKTFFAEYKNMQHNESDTSYNEYKNNKISKDSFTYDGFINYKEYLKADIKILFIARECNISIDIIDDQACSCSEYFWVQDLVLNRENNKVTPFLKRLSFMANAVFEKDFENLNDNFENLNKTAFMNINKRGGLSTTNNTKLKKYTKIYEDMIYNEIAIINPDIIICCGSGLKKVLPEMVVEDTNFNIIEVYHPSCRISYVNYLKRFKETYNSK